MCASVRVKVFLLALARAWSTDRAGRLVYVCLFVLKLEKRWTVAARRAAVIRNIGEDEGEGRPNRDLPFPSFKRAAAVAAAAAAVRNTARPSPGSGRRQQGSWQLYRLPRCSGPVGGEAVAEFLLVWGQVGRHAKGPIPISRPVQVGIAPVATCCARAVPRTAAQRKALLAS